MLLLNTTLLSVQKTNTGQAPRKGAKTTQQKSTKKTVQTSKAAPKSERPLTEEERIIQAAEKYHQQISGKKNQKGVQAEPARTNADTQAMPAAKVNSPKTNLPAKNNQQKSALKTGQTEKANQAGVRSKTGYTAKNAELVARDEEAEGSGRDMSVNIYTGNPGIYRAEGDTLNFWSFSPVPVDTLASFRAVAQLPQKPYGFEGKQMPEKGQDWTFLLVLAGWSVFASLRFGFSKYIVQVFQSIFNFSAAARLYREKGYSSNFGMFRLNLIFYLFLPFPLYLIARDNGVSLMGFSGIEFYLIVFVVANAYYLLKLFLYKILGSVFSQREVTSELIFNMMLYNNVLGLILLPVATVHALVPGFGIASLFLVPGLIVLFYLMSIIRSVYFAIREGISIFYLILYLCALEILPVLLVTKLAMGA